MPKIDNMANRPIRWGILGTGQVAHLFANGLAATPGAILTAVGSRSFQAAEQFAHAHHIARSYDSYAALAESPDVDVVYIATPHVLHHANTRLCLAAGKHVLCEKPFAINASETQTMIDCARTHDRFLMEAMWTTCLPVMCRTRELIAANAIGAPRSLDVWCGFQATAQHGPRMFDPTLGGGALLDMGIYPITLATSLWGAPTQIEAHAEFASTGVDVTTHVRLQFEGGAVATIVCSIGNDLSNTAVITGATGEIRIEPPWWHSMRLLLMRKGQPPQPIDAPLIGNGFNYEAMEAGGCIRSGRRESTQVPLTTTLRNMQVLDLIRQRLSLRYPME